jgi:hypothetical protein
VGTAAGGKLFRSKDSLTGSIWRPDFGEHSVTGAIDGSLIGTRLTDPDTDAYLGARLFYGFTAANGLADDGHFISSAVPVPEPENWALLAIGLALVGWRLRCKAVR